MPAPQVFLSYSSADAAWVENFCRKKWFGLNLGNVEVTDYLDTASFGSINEWIEKEVGNSAGLIAFISSSYTESKFSQVEWDLAQKLHAKGCLIVVPIIMDQNAKLWWHKNKLGPKFGIEGENAYAYLDFIDSHSGKHPVEIVTRDGTIDFETRRIGNLARLLSTKIAALKPPPPPPEKSSVIVLGHPTATRQDSILPDVNELTAQLRGFGITHRAWNDQWAAQDQPAVDDRDMFRPTPVFVQPAAPIDAEVWGSMPKLLTNWLGKAAAKAAAAKVANADKAAVAAKAADEVVKCRTVLWIPARHQSEAFDGHAKLRAETDNPTLRHDTPTDLAGWIQKQIGAEVGPVPVVAIEAMEAGRLQEALQSGCEKVVSGIVRPPPEPWPFYNKESLEDQLRLIEGGRAIIAVHDLNTGLASSLNDARTAVESKVKQHKLRADEIVKSLGRKLDLFWTVLLVDKIKWLPFIKYPGNKLPDVTFLPFRKMNDDMVPVAPDPDGARIYQSYLRDWVGAPN